MALYLIDSGVKEFKTHKHTREVKLQADKEFVKFLADYKQYSGYGIAIQFEPSPLSIYFRNSSFLSFVEGRIDRSESIKINNKLIGEDIKYNRGFYRDFGGFIFFVGSLFMIYMGKTSIRSLSMLKFESHLMGLKDFMIQSTVPRVFFLNLFFIAVMILAYSWVSWNGIILKYVEIRNLLYYCIFTLILLNFFYFAGLLAAILLKFKRSYFLWVLMVWTLIVFLIPAINQLIMHDKFKDIPQQRSIDVLKLKQVAVFEKSTSNRRKWDPKFKNLNKDKWKSYIDSFLESSHTYNDTLENNFSSKVELYIAAFEKRSLLLPFLYYSFLATKISGKDYLGYLRFKEYLLKTHKDFTRFYFNKYYIQKQRKIENFVRENENVFKAQGILPKSFGWSIAITFFYCMLLVVLSYFFLMRMLYYRD
jgi:hypothetical protein